MICKVCKKILTNKSETYMIDGIFLCEDDIQVYIDSKCIENCNQCKYFKACKSENKK